MKRNFTSIALTLLFLLSGYLVKATEALTTSSNTRIWVSIEHFRTQEPARFAYLRVELEDGTLVRELIGHDLSTPIEVPAGATYRIRPISYTGMKSRLVDVYSFAMIKSHLLGLASLRNLCDVVTADINRSGSITAQDLNSLRSKITQEDPNAQMLVLFSLKQDDACPASASRNNDQASALVDAMEEDISVSFLYHIEGDFGTLATLESMIPARKIPLPTSDPIDIYLSTPDIFVEADQWYTIYFQPQTSKNIVAYQFTPMLQSITVQAQHTLLDIMESSNIAYRFQAPISGQLSEILSISADYVDPVAYDEDGNRLRIGIAFETSSSTQHTDGVVRFLARPNPFSETLQLTMEVLDSDAYEIDIFDSTGRSVYQQKAFLSSGKHTLEIPTHMLGHSGVYFIMLSSKDAHMVKRVMKL